MIIKYLPGLFNCDPSYPYSALMQTRVIASKHTTKNFPFILQSEEKLKVRWALFWSKIKFGDSVRHKLGATSQT